MFTQVKRSFICSPIAGHEQKAKRPALVLSPEPFNEKILLALVVTITIRVGDQAFEVPSQDAKEYRVGGCQQEKTNDFVERGITLVEKASDKVVTDALARARTII